ncbi:PfkB family carbohydrate kinase [uncultured Thermanaerothrix sp.]|uniref:carbohydrate kinase family protein n=1 Tax=uncultured Thermanaerothrix sp. TaxID=1195149 RepID=UPI0026154785|nr:PfkB family carbohydrate kinase [uncultured Thermanaerothrix sp.]
MVDFVAFNLILDDIVFPDGRTAMGELGGGGAQTAFGMRLWSDSVGLVASVGPDFPPVWWQWLESWGIDLQGVRRAEQPSLRAWQVLETDGRRTQIWRVSSEALATHLGRRMEWLPATYRQARGFHLGVHPLEGGDEFVQSLHVLGGVVSLEPFKPAEHLPTPEVLRHLVSQATIFSPNLEEAISLLGPASPPILVRQLLEAGTTVVALRLGEHGALLAQRGHNELVHIPPVEVEVVDPVGAGNAFCGGFLVGWVKTGDLVEAGLRGAVSASFLMTQVGMPRLPIATACQMAEERLKQLRTRVMTLPLR